MSNGFFAWGTLHNGQYGTYLLQCIQRHTRMNWEIIKRNQPVGGSIIRFYTLNERTKYNIRVSSVTIFDFIHSLRVFRIDVKNIQLSFVGNDPTKRTFDWRQKKKTKIRKTKRSHILFIVFLLDVFH